MNVNVRASEKPKWQVFTNKSIGQSEMKPSPDVKYLAYSDLDTHIHVVDLDTGESRILSTHAANTQISCLSWSPDGSKIAYQSTTENGDHVNHVLDLTGKAQVIDRSRPPQSYSVVSQPGRVVRVRGEFGCPLWAGSNMLGYQRFTGPFPQFTTLSCYFGVVCSGSIEADTTTVATVTRTGITLRNLPERWFVETASSDSVLIRDTGEHLFLARSSDFGAANAKEFTRLQFCETGACTQMVFSPDGKQVAFLFQSGVQASVELIDVAPPHTRTGIPTKLGIVSSFTWSPNSKKIALAGTAIKDGAKQRDLITVVDLPAKKEMSIVTTSHDMSTKRPAWIGDEYLVVLAVAPQTGLPSGTKGVLGIVRVVDGAAYLLPPVPEGVTVPEVLCWRGAG